MINKRASVMGTDHIVPIHAPDDRWTTFSEEEVWMGQEGAQPDGVTPRYVPKVMDHVVRPTTNERWYVESLDPVTYIPVLRKIVNSPDHDLSEDDILSGVGPVANRDNFRVYINTLYTPYSMIVDSQLVVAGEEVTYAKIFRGSDIGNQGKVVSRIYDGMGNFISENIPLELVAKGYHVNHSIKRVAPCNTTETFEDGELLTVVFYNDKGGVVSRTRLMAENSNAYRALEKENREVSHISLSSPFMSKSIDNQIDFPLNFTMESLNLMGTVHYTDGSTLTLPVDGRKFTLHGLENHLSTIIGQKNKLVLSYALSSDESSQAVASDNRTVSIPVTLVTIDPNYSYSVKLFGYPDWKGVNEGYHMRWWLLNLERNIYFEVTPFVRFVTTKGAYDPKAYGVLQRKQVSVNLSDVSGAFKSFNHTQNVDIVLNAPPLPGNTPWLVSHESVDTRPFYGDKLLARLRSGNKLDISADILDYDQWLDKVFHSTFPLFRQGIESELRGYPRPTHVEVFAGNDIKQIRIEDWNKDITLSSNPIPNSLVVLRFFTRTNTQDSTISVAAMMLDI